MANQPIGDKKNIVKLAYLYFQEGRWDNAIEEYQKLLELDPEDMNIHNMLGDVYVRKNSPVQAYEKYSKVADDLIARGQMDKALMINRKIARLDGNTLSPEARQKQSLIQLHMKAEEAMEETKVEEAIEAYSAILKLNPDDLIVASKLAELDEKTGRVQDAVQQYLLLGDSFMKSHLFKKAQEMFKKVVLMDPDNEVAHLNLAQIYVKQGSENDAKKEYLNVAEHALSKNDLDAALDYASKAVDLKSIEAHYIMGVVLFKKEKWAEAKTEFDNLLRFKVGHVGALVYLGRVFAAMGQADKAAESFQKAIKLDKENPAILEAWADFNITRKNKTEALAALNPLVDKALTGSDPAATVALAQKLVLADETLPASKMKLAEALNKNGDTNGAADVYYDLSQLYAGQNKTAEAETYLQKTLQLNPSHVKAGASKVAAVVEAPVEVPVVEEARSPEASQAQVVDVSPQEAFKAQLSIADQYVKQGLVDEAIDIYQQLLEVEPDNADVKKKLNGVYSALAQTGTDLSGVFASPTPAPKVEEAPKKPAAEVKAAADDAAKKNLKDLENKAREEADKRARVELEKRAREEANKRADEEIKRLADEKAKKAKAQETPVAPVTAAPVAAKPLPAMGGLDDMVAVAEADLLQSQGKSEEAAKIYRNILSTNPDNQAVKKKLEALDETMRSKMPPATKAPVLKVVETAPVTPAPAGENDSNIKKKSNKIGYV